MSDLRKSVETLPTVDSATYPQLPQLPEGRALKVFDSPLRKSEPEDVLAIVTTAAIRQGKWHPVPADVFGQILLQVTSGGFMGQGVINALWQLAGQGMVDILQFEGKDYVLPHPQFANVLTSSKIRWM